VSVEIPDRAVKSVYDALKPESESALTSWSKVHVEEKNDGLLLDFYAVDTSSLRAAINSYLQWVSMLLDIVDDLK